jgi:hypothetical protein
MGISYNPSIVTDGLVLALDAGNTKSYDGNENLVTYSGIPSANWNALNSVVLTNNSSTSPDGTTNATQFAGAALVSSGVYAFTPTLTSGTAYTYSLFVKAVSGSNTIYFGTDSGTTATVQVNTSTGVASLHFGSPTNITTTSYPNSWYRISFTFTAGATATHSFVIYNLTANSNTWLAWGAQLEKGSSANTYYPTTGTTKTRGSTWTDLSGNGNTGTLTNGPTYSSANGGSIGFDGTDDYSSISHTSTLNPGTGSFTFGGFFKTNADALSNYYPVHLSKSQGDWSNGYIIRAVYPYTGGYSVAVSQGGNDGVDRRTITSTLTASLGVWVNIVGVWNAPSRTLTLYFNGVANATGTTTNSLTINPTANLEFGRYNRITQSRFEYVNGNIAQVSIYNRALSATEIQQNFNALRGRYGI